LEPLYYEEYGPDLRVRTLARTVTETDLVNFVALSGMYGSLFIKSASRRSARRAMPTAESSRPRIGSRTSAPKRSCSATSRG
jgi:hypothetical protein